MKENTQTDIKDKEAGVENGQAVPTLEEAKEAEFVGAAEPATEQVRVPAEEPLLSRFTESDNV